VGLRADKKLTKFRDVSPDKSRPQLTKLDYFATFDRISPGGTQSAHVSSNLMISQPDIDFGESQTFDINSEKSLTRAAQPTDGTLRNAPLPVRGR